MKSGKISNSKIESPALGEILSSSITGFTAQLNRQQASSHLSFGSFLKVDAGDGMEIMAVIYDVITGPQDSHHRPAALGMTREQLQLEQPQIFALLSTQIHAQTIGYRLKTSMQSGLPPRPPQVHDFVFAAAADEIIEVTQSLEFLRLLSSVSSVPVDELLAAAVRHAYLASSQDYSFLVKAGQSLSHLFREDYDRLMSLLRKIKPEPGL